MSDHLVTADTVSKLRPMYYSLEKASSIIPIIQQFIIDDFWKNKSTSKKINKKMCTSTMGW